MFDLARVVSDAQRASPAAPVNPSVLFQLSRAGNVLTAQSVVGGKDSTFQDIQQMLALNLADRDYYFGMMVYDRQGRRLNADRKLCAGETYRLQIAVTLARYVPLGIADQDLPLTQNAAKIDKQIELHLFVGHDAAPLVQAAGMEQGSILDWSAEAQFQLPRDFAGPDIRLQLASGPLVSLLAELNYAVEGAPAAAQPQAVSATFVPAEPPPQTALLHVDPDGTDRIRFTVFLRERVNRPQALDPIARPITAPANYNDESEYLESIRDQVHDLALNNPAKLTDWLEEVVRLYGESCCVVIVDKADSQIPWEMFKLSNNRYLGAVATVVRWPEAQYRSQPVELQTMATSLAGRLAAYVHQQDWNDAPAYLKNLAPPPAQDPDDLETVLLTQEGVPPVSLVYLNYGGMLIYGDEGGEFAGQPTVMQRYSRPVKFRYSNVEGELNPRPLFFVDAAYSGRILRSAGNFRGLAQATLTQVASAYIGTLGPVPRDFAAQVAQEFLTAAKAGVQPALLLRKLRARAAASLRDPQLPPAQRRRFLYAFLYVYYGNPLLQVTI